MSFDRGSSPGDLNAVLNRWLDEAALVLLRQLNRTTFGTLDLRQLLAPDIAPGVDVHIDQAVAAVHRRAGHLLDQSPVAAVLHGNALDRPRQSNTALVEAADMVPRRSIDEWIAAKSAQLAAEGPLGSFSSPTTEGSPIVPAFASAPQIAIVKALAAVTGEGHRLPGMNPSATLPSELNALLSRRQFEPDKLPGREVPAYLGRYDPAALLVPAHQGDERILVDLLPAPELQTLEAIITKLRRGRQAWALAIQIDQLEAPFAAAEAALTKFYGDNPGFVAGLEKPAPWYRRRATADKRRESFIEQAGSLGVEYRRRVTDVVSTAKPLNEVLRKTFPPADSFATSRLTANDFADLGRDLVEKVDGPEKLDAMINRCVDLRVQQLVGRAIVAVDGTSVSNSSPDVLAHIGERIWKEEQPLIGCEKPIALAKVVESSRASVTKEAGA